MDQNASYLDDYEELKAKTVKAEVKTGLWASFYVWKTDQQVLQGSGPAPTTELKIRTQGVITNHCKDEVKAKVSVPTSTKDCEPSNKARKNKNKK